MNAAKFTWLNNQGVRGQSGFELQRNDRFTMTYSEGSNAITIDIENGVIGGKYAVLIKPDAVRCWDNGEPLDDEKETQVLENIREALAFQQLELGVE